MMQSIKRVPSAQNAVPEQRWLCKGEHRRRLSRGLFTITTVLSAALHRLLPTRVACDVWIRYRRTLDDGCATPSAVALTPLSEQIVERLRRHPLRDRDQMRSGIRFWEHGLRDAFIWFEGQEPLCMQWLFLPSHNERLRALPNWSDLYLPLPPGSAYAENIFAFPRGLRRRGGAATDFAQAMFAQASQAGVNCLYTHAHRSNLAARRWAERTGWKAYGEIRRYRLDLPLLRNLHWCLHGLDAVPPLPSAQKAPAAPARPSHESADDLSIGQLAGR